MAIDVKEVAASVLTTTRSHLEKFALKVQTAGAKLREVAVDERKKAKELEISKGVVSKLKNLPLVNNDGDFMFAGGRGWSAKYGEAREFGVANYGGDRVSLKLNAETTEGDLQVFKRILDENGYELRGRESSRAFIQPRGDDNVGMCVAQQGWIFKDGDRMDYVGINYDSKTYEPTELFVQKNVFFVDEGVPKNKIYPVEQGSR